MTNNHQNLRELKEEDLDYLLEWRNDVKVKSFMHNSKNISKKEHTQWFYESKNNDFKHLLIYEELDEPLGFLQFLVDPIQNNAEWGFYKKPNAYRGVGMRMGKLGIETARRKLNVNKITGIVKDSNKSSIDFHIKLGFNLVDNLLSPKSEYNMNDIHFEMLL